MKIGDLVKRRMGSMAFATSASSAASTPGMIGVITRILCEDKYRVLDVEVLVCDSREEWEADEVEVI